MEFPDKKYKIIYCDPAWSYDDKSLNRGGALRHYPTMEIEDIANLPVAEITDDDCILFMWTTFPKIFESKQVIDACFRRSKTHNGKNEQHIGAEHVACVSLICPPES